MKGIVLAVDGEKYLEISNNNNKSSKKYISS